MGRTELDVQTARCRRRPRQQLRRNGHAVGARPGRQPREEEAGRFGARGEGVEARGDVGDEAGDHFWDLAGGVVGLVRVEGPGVLGPERKGGGLAGLEEEVGGGRWEAAATRGGRHVVRASNSRIGGCAAGRLVAPGVRGSLQGSHGPSPLPQPDGPGQLAGRLGIDLDDVAVYFSLAQTIVRTASPIFGHHLPRQNVVVL